MGIVLILNFTHGDIVISEYTALDINRQCSGIHINVTNTLRDFAFNRVFEQIREISGDDGIFDVTARQENGEVMFTGMTADYYLSNQAEILHFTNLRKQSLMDETGQTKESENGAELE